MVTKNQENEELLNQDSSFDAELLEEEKNVNPTYIIPRSDVDLHTTADTVSQRWATMPQYTLIWTDQPTFAGQVNLFGIQIDEISNLKDSRKDITDNLTAIDKKTDDSLEYIKGYIIEKYGKKEAKKYFKDFGIVEYQSAYVIPKDHDNRQRALAKLLNGLVTHGFDGNTYGIAFWGPIKADFDTYFRQAIDTDSMITSKINEKNNIRDIIIKTLLSIIHVAKANYPDDKEAKLRALGFQKEKY